MVAAAFAVVFAAGASFATPGQAQAKLRNARFARTAALSAPIKSYGSSSAPIKMEVFTDYECPVCRALYEQTLRPMISEYVSSGKVYLVHHDYPLDNSEHAHSAQAARWANVAAQFGQFEAVEAALYDNQDAWHADGDIAKYVAGAMSSSEFQRVAKVMAGCEAPGPKGHTGGFVPPPHPCAIDTYIEKDIALGNQIPLQATPTYIITYKGQRLPAGTGFVSWPVLKQFFDSLLRQ
ncbi:MAG TPA: thioredoxin domain-containing protein [Candidatus Acidoferrum sp.]|nr:thioredoxin domain-containing protein [Candidatus Acidoferrum sp.]